MTIKDNRFKEKPFVDVRLGDVFYYNGCYLIKAGSFQPYEEPETEFVAVDVETGILKHVPYLASVEVLKAELVIS